MPFLAKLLLNMRMKLFKWNLYHLTLLKMPDLTFLITNLRKILTILYCPERAYYCTRAIKICDQYIYNDYAAQTMPMIYVRNVFQNYHSLDICPYIEYYFLKSGSNDHSILSCLIIFWKSNIVHLKENRVLCLYKKREENSANPRL